MCMKQLYNVLFEQNSDKVKEIRHQYVQVNRTSSMQTQMFSAVSCVLCVLPCSTLTRQLCVCVFTVYIVQYVVHYVAQEKLL